MSRVFPSRLPFVARDSPVTPMIGSIQRLGYLA